MEQFEKNRNKDYGLRKLTDQKLYIWNFNKIKRDSVKKLFVFTDASWNSNPQLDASITSYNEKRITLRHGNATTFGMPDGSALSVKLGTLKSGDYALTSGSGYVVDSMGNAIDTTH